MKIPLTVLSLNNLGKVDVPGLSSPDHTLKEKPTAYGAMGHRFESLVRSTLERFPQIPRMANYNAALEYNYQMLKILSGRHFITKMKRLERDFLMHELEMARHKDIDWRSFSRKLKVELESQIHAIKTIEEQQRLTHMFFKRAKLAMERNQEAHLKHWLKKVEERAFWVHKKDQQYRNKIADNEKIIKNLEQDRLFVKARPISVSSMNITGVLNELPWASAGRVMFVMQAVRDNQMKFAADNLVEHGHAGLPSEVIFASYKFNKAAWIRLTKKIKAEDQHLIQIRNLRRELEDTFRENHKDVRRQQQKQIEVKNDYRDAWKKENCAAPITMSFNSLTGQNGLFLLNKTNHTGSLLRFLSNSKKMNLYAHAEQIMEHIGHNIPAEVWGSFSIAPEWHSEAKYTNHKTIRDRKRRLAREKDLMDQHVLAEFEKDRNRVKYWHVEMATDHDKKEQDKIHRNFVYIQKLMRARELNGVNPRGFINDSSTRINPENDAIHRDLGRLANAFEAKKMGHFAFAKPDSESPNFALHHFLAVRANHTQTEDYHFRNNPDIKTDIWNYNVRVNPQVGADERYQAKYLTDSKLKVDSSSWTEKNIVTDRPNTDMGRTSYQVAELQKTGWVKDIENMLKGSNKKAG